MPYYPEDDDGDVRHQYKIFSTGAHMVAQYAGVSLLAALELDLIDFLILRRDAYISLLMRSKAGQEYLDKAWCREQTEPDRAALRKMVAGGGACALK